MINQVMLRLHQCAQPLIETHPIYIPKSGSSLLEQSMIHLTNFANKLMECILKLIGNEGGLLSL